MKRMMMATLVAVVLFGMAACGGRQAAWDGRGERGERDSALADEGALLVSEGDAFWDQRTDPERIRDAIARWEQAVELDPDDGELWAKISRGYYFLADGYLRDDDKAYTEAMEKGTRAGEEAMMAFSPEFAERMQRGAKVGEGIEVLGPEALDAMYWYATNLGKWAGKQSIAIRLRHRSDIEQTMSRILELDEMYFHAAGHRFFGALYALLPGFAGRDLDKSREHFEKSIALAPNYVATRVLMAENLAVPLRDREMFETQLRFVLDAPDDIIPELVAETLVEKEKARELIAKIDDLF
jgi:tetratricopeptide (TPR) repeat protein